MNSRITQPLGNLFLLLIVVSTSTLGAIYAIHNTDSHHWGFVLGTTLDFIHGRALFTQTYVQYGAGVPLLFKLINKILPITYTNIGLLTSAVYAGTVGLIFVSIRRVGSTQHAVLLTIVALLIHPYAVFPWPDYYAGFCLIVACYLLVTNVPMAAASRGAVIGLMLFFAFLFRNTYLVNLLAGAGAYLVLSRAIPRLNDQRVTTAIAVFLVLVALYLLLLVAQAKLHLWYGQNFGAATTVYGIGESSAQTWLSRMLSPYDMQTVAITAALWINWYVAWSVVFRSTTIEHDSISDGAIIFLIAIGSAGLVQGLQFYEPFRLQNACSPLYLGVAYVLSRTQREPGRRSVVPSANLALGALIVALCIKAPNLFNGHAYSTIWPLVEEPKDFFGQPLISRNPGAVTYSWSEGIPVFRGHRFLPDVQNYYRDLANVLCASDKKIVNLTNDSMVPYLCNDERNALYLPVFPYGLLKNISLAQMSRILRGEFATDELIVSDAAPPVAKDRRLIQIASVARPYQVRWAPTNKNVWIFAVEPREPVVGTAQR